LSISLSKGPIMTDKPTIRIERPDPATALLTIDRPERRNALTRVEIVALRDVLESAGRDETISTIVLTGNGAFCAGADLRGLRDTVSAGPVEAGLYGPAHAMIQALIDVPVPTIAAIDGPAVGMGADLALACDCRLIGLGGWLRQGWAAHGVIPATGGIRFLRHLSPIALWRMLDGQPAVDGPLAERLGLGESVADGTALDAALARARSYADIPRPALEAYVRLSRRDVRAGLAAELAECAEIQAALFNRRSFADSLDRALGATREVRA
jgi:enoyl-CoA hydratase/carnithine racemase